MDEIVRGSSMTKRKPPYEFYEYHWDIILDVWDIFMNSIFITGISRLFKYDTENIIFLDLFPGMMDMEMDIE